MLNHSPDENKLQRKHPQMHLLKSFEIFLLKLDFSDTVGVLILGWHQCLRHCDLGSLPDKQTQH